ncbi:MAG: hypothetical protein ACI9FJ_001797 [Alteromonadaceae bacterium]|jgi:hypothetical protein
MPLRQRLLPGSLLLAMLLSLPVIAAEDGDWGDDWDDEQQTAQAPSPWQFSGFIEGAFGDFLQTNIAANHKSLNELRSRIKVDHSHDKFELTASGDLLYDDILNDTIWHTRELNIAASPLANLDIKLGRQILTWGTGDYLFLNDLFAKDWQSFFAGRDDEYLKAPSDSARVTGYIKAVTIDLAWTPEFAPDNYLNGERFSFYSPQAQQLVAPAEHFRVNTTNKDQWSIRLATNQEGIEYALYGYHGVFNTPQAVDEQGVAYFPPINAFGGSIRMPLASGVFNSEFSVYNSTSDSKGNNPFIANGQVRFLLGYEQELVKNLTASAQYYLEKTSDYNAFEATSPNPAIVVDEYRQLLTLRLRYTAMQQKLTYSLFSFYSPTDQDSYIRPSISYRKNDSWLFSAGANLFNGKDNFSFFGQHQDNSNIWARVRLVF